MTAEALKVRIIESRRIASSLRGKEVIKKKGGRLTDKCQRKPGKVREKRVPAIPTRVFLVRENQASLSENREKKKGLWMYYFTGSQGDE